MSVMPNYGYIPKPGSRAWVAKVGNLLRDGYGVEDIAILTESPLQKVQNMVRIFRAAGMLEKWWPK